MKERPLLMSGPLVLATLADRKTQTRRLPRPGGYGQPGDRLWVRETWACRHTYNNAAKRYDWTIFYDADHAQRSGLQAPPEWREPQRSAERPFSEELVNLPSIHMPRWASRLTLEILEVRTEPLQAITEEDAQAEGLPRNWADWVDSAKFKGSEHGWLTPAGVRHIEKHPEDDCDDGGMVPGGRAYVFEARECFRLWWDHLNGTRAPWSANPEVVVITFKRVTS